MRHSFISDFNPRVQDNSNFRLHSIAYDDGVHTVIPGTFNIWGYSPNKKYGYIPESVGQPEGLFTENPLLSLQTLSAGIFGLGEYLY